MKTIEEGLLSLCRGFDLCGTKQQVGIYPLGVVVVLLKDEES